ncbi:MAG: hypothetical protein COY39_00410 [Alphaproteobacteria bacterium CG_4_10_14_0_8_um_filter_37_21]|nr:MAG: hypothetical protein COY39_00410 [Alphaproteobacteria bacterium CG_4_10_14_0_8_um_filter_37_21]
MNNLSEIKRIATILKKSVLYFLLSILVNMLSKGLLSPLLFIILLYRTPLNTEMPWYVSILIGVCYDSMFFMPIGFHPVLLLCLQASINYGQKYTFERSQLRYWGGFGILCLIGFLAETFGRFLIGHESYLNAYTCINYILLWSVYPIFQTMRKT